MTKEGNEERRGRKGEIRKEKGRIKQKVEKKEGERE
jgi:hypothetical protein